MTLEQALLYVLTPAGLAAFLSLVIERVPAFNYLPATTKKWVILGLMFGLPLVATGALTYLRPHLAVLEPYWQAIYIAGLVFTSGQFTHWFDTAVIQSRQRENTER